MFNTLLIAFSKNVTEISDQNTTGYHNYFILGGITALVATTAILNKKEKRKLAHKQLKEAMKKYKSKYHRTNIWNYLGALIFLVGALYFAARYIARAY